MVCALFVSSRTANTVHTGTYPKEIKMRFSKKMRLLTLSLALSGAVAAERFAIAENSASSSSPSGEKAAAEKPVKKTSDASAVVDKKVRSKSDITFDDLAFDIEKDGKFEEEMLTPDIKELDKKNIKLRGYILPTSVFQQKGIKQFVLVRDNQECCFGPGAAIYDCVIVEMDEGKTTDFSVRVVTVTGKFNLDTQTYVYPDGKHFAIYKMKATSVE